MKKAFTQSSNSIPEGRRALHRLLAVVSVFVVFSILGGLYLHFSYKRYQLYAREKAMTLVESIETLLDPRLVSLVTGSYSDPARTEYTTLKRMLMQFRKKNGAIRFAYLIAERNEKYYFLIDSEPANSPDYSPPGQPYTDELNSVKEVFVTGVTVVGEPETDHWGTWVSALTPVREAGSGRILAALGIDYPANVWRQDIFRQMTPDVVIVCGLVLILTALYWVLAERLRLSRLSRRLAANEELFRAVFDQAPIGIAVTLRDRFTFTGLNGNSGINQMFEKITGRTEAELSGMRWVDFTHPDDIPATLDQYKRVREDSPAGYAMEKRYIRPDGSVVWVNLKVSRLLGMGSVGDQHYLALLEDISARKHAEQALRESERSKAVLLSHLPGMAYRCRFDREWTMEFVSEGCLALTGYAPESLLSNRDISYNGLIAPEYHESLRQEWQRVLANRENFRYEYQIVTRNGERKWVLELGQGIYGEDEKVTALEGIAIDITNQKDNEARILYMSEHDAMTGLFNRRYYERRKKALDDAEYLPLSLAVCDIDGLHLVNDVFGVQAGDQLILEAARLLQSVSREDDVLIRTGGDEFTLIMPKTVGVEAELMNRRIHAVVQAYNAGIAKSACELSLSVGCSTRTSLECSFSEVVRAARESMHYHKLLERRSPHSSILSSMMATMLARSRETEAHGERLVSLSTRLGRKLGLGQKEMDELELYAMLHDIGKVGIDDRILNKPGKLTDEEWDLMKKHSEIGYRIAASAAELSHVADYILCHHERWDGRGYPRGLSGEQIPLLSRILAIVDAYDAMTENRVYRRAMSDEAAVAEIERGAGSQFDPTLSRFFIELIRN